MKCPKCNTANELGNFCSNCGTHLKEKCSICGKIERLGRLVCETKYESARNKYWEMYAEKDTVYILLSLTIAILGSIGIAVVGVMISNYIKNKSVQNIWGLSMLVFAFLWPFIVGMYTELTEPKSERKREIEFYEKFPEYDGIFEKKEEEK